VAPSPRRNEECKRDDARANQATVRTCVLLR